MSSSTISLSLISKINKAACHDVQGDAEYVLAALPMQGPVGRSARDPHLPLHHAEALEMPANDHANPSLRIDAFTASGPCFPPLLRRMQLLSTCCAVPYTFPGFLG
jgi:hypothetical protein